MVVGGGLEERQICRQGNLWLIPNVSLVVYKIHYTLLFYMCFNYTIAIKGLNKVYLLP